MTIKRIGFACKLSEMCPKKGIISVPEYNLSGTTVTWLNKQPRDVSVEKLWSLLESNLLATTNLIKKVGEFDPELRMVRLGSDMLPVYTHPDWKWFWKQPDVIKYAENNFAKIGELARNNDVRLSMHPGQFVVLSSDNDDIVERSIEEFEYHVDMARWMGYGQSFQDFKINVHISGRRGPDGIRAALERLSPEAKNTITIENDEMSWGIDASLELAKDLALVLDIHHHWVKTGEYIEPNSDVVKKVIDSWRGVRPVLHYSVSREDVLVGHCNRTLPDHSLLLESGHKKGKLRAHSDFFWNESVNEWALSFQDTHDIMCESKGKNLASFALNAFNKRT